MAQASNIFTEKPVKYEIMMHGICFTLKIFVIIVVVVLLLLLYL